MAMTNEGTRTGTTMQTATTIDSPTQDDRYGDFLAGVQERFATTVASYTRNARDFAREQTAWYAAQRGPKR